ncbi:MAG: aspartate--tRNA ligase [Candidatus Omnitrophica bacterium]|nr:aspartate--tRNA ligase [Candidatus Omnitrophota bacterium]
MLRTHTCGELNEKNVRDVVSLCGWVHSRRDHGELIFVDLRDRYGVTQLVFNPEENRDLHTGAHKLKSEFVIQIKGVVESRPKDTENPKLPTGKIEVRISDLKILSESKTPPFEIEDTTKASEEVRLQYRYLDIRRPVMQKKLELRHRICKRMRDYLDKNGYLELETPILTKSTPEGARDFLVPSRLSPGEFFALPQSPQLFKQLLMVSGCDKYFQIARCFRDEDLRADRQPEFTQLDIEASFVEEEDIYVLCEGLIKELYKEALGIEISTPFKRLAYQDAMEKFGTDKPDLRFGCEIKDLTEDLKDVGFKIFKKTIESGGRIKAISVPGAAKLSLSKINELTKFVGEFGAKGLAYLKVEKGALTSQIAKFFKDEELNAIREKLGAKTGDMIFFAADKKDITLRSLGNLRLHLGCELKLIDESKPSLLWICEFPLFKYNEEEKRWETEHHPFTSPKEENMEKFDKDKASIKARAYDLVINGTEIASGSIRIHDRKMQEKLFSAIGIEKDEAQMRFGFLLQAFQYGVPPHGGIAVGLDRLITLFTKDRSIREIIPFPKTQKGVCPLTGAPSPVVDEQLKELNIKLRK